MNKYSSIILGLLVSFYSHAICVNNTTNLNLFYEIDNNNRVPPLPKIKHYEGELRPGERHCYPEKSGDPERAIYRYDLITIYKMAEGRTRACQKNVNGIFNYLTIIYHDFSGNWFCLNREDEDYS